MSDQAREAQVRGTINQKLVDSGEKERLKDFLRSKLTQGGWRDDQKERFKEIIKKYGADQITAEELVLEIQQDARAAVSVETKKELLERIRAFLAPTQN